MATQYNTTAYAYSAAPRQERREETPYLVPQKRKTRHQLQQERRRSLVGAVKAFTVACVLFALFGAIIFSRITLIKERQETESLKASLSVYESENVRLNVLLNSFASDEAIDDYAVNVLGMKKLERYQIHYFEQNTDDEAIVYDD